ncbi:type I restriction-modification system subunit M [Brochothrix thermosphacta]|uniref:type I restriction-modification system subunit M n=1 Tax=Brochothrix thermosphacta TaxID=2756 RepID=UPI0039AEFC19
MITTEEIKRRLRDGANNLRGSMDAGRYKDYVLGLMFYKFLSDKTLDTFKELSGLTGVTEGELVKDYRENHANLGTQLEKNLQQTLGYYVLPEYLYQTWLEDIRSGTFDVQKITDSLNHFERTIAITNDSEDFKGLFSASTLDFTNTGLGSTLNERSKSIKALILLFADLNMVSLQKGNILGESYEYLIGQFAMESGAKAGEFYTPQQVSEVMAQIVAKTQTVRSIYDPTVGSGSLLLTVKKHLSRDAQRNLTFYGQEKNTATYNLTRMNLLLHGVRSEKMSIKNGDTLGPDWPENYSRPYEGMRFDAVVMNPPYSVLNWNRFDLNVSDPRFELFGVLPPDSKGDYAFLLHGLYHLKTEGTMAIVLPIGVLFRGGAEGDIRQSLIDNNQIEAVICLPDKIFFNTSIPVCIIILKKKRMESDVLFVDASKEFGELKNRNQLRAEDINKIVEIVANKEEKENYSYIATIDEIKGNDYNLNVQNYVDVYGVAKIITDTNFEYIRELKGSKKYMEAVFVAIKYKNLHKNSEMEKFVFEFLKGAKSNQEQLLSDGVSFSKVVNKLAWARSFLKANNIIDNQKKGYWTLTNQGEKIKSIYFDNKYFDGRFDTIDSFVFKSLHVFDEDRPIYNVEFDKSNNQFNEHVINKSILIGENGAGKSSILRAISQIYLVLSKNQERNVRVNLNDLDYTSYNLKYKVNQDVFRVELVKEKSNIKIICEKNDSEIPFSHLLFPKKTLAISTIVNDTFMFSSNDYYKYLGTRSSSNGSFKGELDKSTIRYFSNIDSNDRMGYLVDILEPLDIAKIFLKNNQLFVSKNKVIFKFEYLSSGEKNYLNIFMAIISEADTSNIILIDEPESSLHPSWQIDFLSELDKLLQKMKIISHVIIATHSHFLVSDVHPENSYIIHCFKNEECRNVTQLIESDTYGWSAENVLYNIFGMRTTRNSYFFNDMNRMINLVENQSTDYDDLKNIVVKLKKYSLSIDDPLNNVIKIAEEYYYENKTD